MVVQEKLKALFNIHSGEVQMVLLLLGLGLLENFANVFARTTTYALFLAEYDAATLPYTYIGIAILATLVSTAYLKLTERFSLSVVLLSNAAFITVLLFGLWIGTTFTGAQWVTFSLPIAFGILNTLMITAYWGLIGRVFNIQQSKRLAGLIASSETIAFMAGGFLMPVLVHAVGGASNVLLVAAILMLIALGVSIYVNRFFAVQLSAPPQKKEVDQAPGAAGSVLKSRYVRLIFILFTLFIVGIYFVDNTFFALAEIQYPDADQLASFVGLFWGVSSVVVMLMQGFVSGRILVRFGVGVVMMLTPTIILVESGLMALVGTLWGIVPLVFWLGVTANVSRVVLDATDQAAVNVLYQPLPADARTRAQTVVNGILYPVSIGLAGVLLLLFRQVLNFDVVQSTYILVLIGIAWLTVAVLLRRDYPKALLRALTRRDFGDTDYLIGDAASLAIFRQGLASPHTGVVVYSLDMLQQAAPELMVENLPQLLQHQELEVRLDVLRRIEQLDLASAIPAIRQRLAGESSADVRGAALRTLATLCDDEDLFDEILAYLDHPDQRIRAGALVGLLRSGQIEGIVAAAGKLTAGVNSDDPAARGFAARVLGEGGISSFYRPLLKLLEDEEPEVRRLALAAAGKLKNPRLWPAVIANLASSRVGSAAVSALVNGGESALPQLRSTLASGRLSRPALIRLIQALGRIGGVQSGDILGERLDFPDEQVRTEILTALKRCGYRAAAGQEQRIEEKIRAEAAQAAWLSAALFDLGQDETTWLLRSALEQHLNRLRYRLFSWCSFIYDPQVVKRVQETLTVRHSPNGSSAADQQKSYALEAIDVILPANLKSLVLPLLEGLPPNQLLGRLQASYPQERQSQSERLRQILDGPEEWLTPWTKSAALFTAARLPLPQLTAAAVSALTSPDAIVRETAVWSVNKLDPAQNRELLPKLLADPDPGVVDMVRGLLDGRPGDETMLSTVEKVIALKALSYFADTPDEVLAEVTAALEEVRVSAGETIFKKDEVGSSLYIISEGHVRIHDGERTFSVLKGGEVFGEMSILDAAPRSASATALEESLLLRLDQESFRELLNDHSDVAWRVMQLLSQRLRNVMSLNAAEGLEARQVEPAE